MIIGLMDQVHRVQQLRETIVDQNIKQSSAEMISRVGVSEYLTSCVDIILSFPRTGLKTWA